MLFVFSKIKIKHKSKNKKKKGKKKEKNRERVFFYENPKIIYERPIIYMLTNKH